MYNLQDWSDSPFRIHPRSNINLYRRHAKNYKKVRALEVNSQTTNSKEV